VRARALDGRRPAAPPRDPLSVVLRSDDALAAPGQPVARPRHVRLLEPGVEVGLVVGRQSRPGTPLDGDHLHGLVGGLVLAGSLVARDVELETGQPVEAASYPSFTAVGNALVLVDRDDLKRVVDLRLTVTVNGRVRQDVLVGDEQVSDVHDVLRAATRFQRLDPGDLVLTGAPGGGAWLPGTPLDRVVDGVLGPARAGRRAIRRELGRPGYLEDGDVVEVRAATGDGTLDLGGFSRVLVPAGR
jgi:2-keto-4-pentenoate hydratase/2-oxohepta-3-ene-1,7-dioic acid hydratase in catechol pathway